MFDCLVCKMYFTVLLALIKIALCENFELNKTQTADIHLHATTDLSSTTPPDHKVQIQNKWLRCGTSSKCTGKDTLFEKFGTYYNCYCDNACYETFQDCCSDFVKTCGEQKKTNTKNSQPLWKCLAVLYDYDCEMDGLRGIWMIANCSRNWPLDETRTRCENAPKKISFPVEDYLPVVGKNGFTYRNKHCAECNKETRFQTWKVFVTTPVMPPKEYNLDAKLWFVLANWEYIDYIGPRRDIPRRFCSQETYVDSCFNTSHSAYQECLNGPVEPVTGRPRGYFKNKACALCNGETTTVPWQTPSVSCRQHKPIPGVRFSRVYDKAYLVIYTRSESIYVNQEMTKNCSEGLVYDDTSKYCREGVVTKRDDVLLDVFMIMLLLESGAIEIPLQLQNITKHLRLSLVKKFALKPNQLTEFQFYGQYLVATFHLTLTPYQEFILDNQNNTSILNISNESQKFLGLLKFTTNFTMQSGGYRFPVRKLVSKQLACFEGRKLQSHEYEHDNISGNVIENATGKVFSKNEYKILGKIGENITTCRRLVLAGCHNGAFVTLYKYEYIVYKNLTILHYQTNRTFNFGEYQIIAGGGSNGHGLDIFPRNLEIAICLPFRQTFKITEKIKVATKSDTGYPLRILTLICFSISIMFLFILLLAYWMFNELRTLPGLNLMSLAVSMLLSQLIWLVGTAQFMNTKTCEVLGIIEHYLFLVTFMAMSVISFHSCIVFSRPFNTIANNARPVLPKFTKYSSMAWISPAIFIAVCVTLDQTEATFDIYGTTCWLSTGKAVLYLFILPAAVIMLFNIVTFIKTALALCNRSDSQLLHKNRKQNLIACTKLATLVGFPWLFAFFGVIFPDTEAFEYLFVVFACLQGFYMGVAFVCNKKTLQLYKNWWNTTHSQSSPRDETFEML